MIKAPFKFASPCSAFSSWGHSHCASWSSWRAISRGSRKAERMDGWGFCSWNHFCILQVLHWQEGLHLTPSATLSLVFYNIKLWISKFLCAEEEEALWVSYPKYLIVCLWEGLLWEGQGEFEMYRVAGATGLSNFLGKYWKHSISLHKSVRTRILLN